MIETEKHCPLGQKCRTIVDEKIVECNWFVTLEGMNPTNGEHVKNEMCALAAIPILLVQQAKMTNEMGGAIESHRNTMLERQDVANVVLKKLVGNNNEKTTAITQ